MNTLNLKAIMKTPAHFCAGTITNNAPTNREVLECGSPLPLWNGPGSTESGRGLPQSKTLARWQTFTPLKRGVNEIRAAAAALLGLFCFAGAAIFAAQPPNYSDPTAVASYVKQMLYWPDAAASTNFDARDTAFRYKVLLYTNSGGVRPDLTNMANLYREAERATSNIAEAHVRRGLTNNPNSALLQDLLLDLYYDRTVAEAILAREAVEKAERTHFGPPIARPATGDFIVDDEIAAYEGALQSNRVALASYCTLLTNSLGAADVAGMPLGYRLFQERVPGRGLAPASYLSNGVPVSVTTNTGALFGGYKDLVLLYELLCDQGRTAATLARLRLLRNGPGDVSGTGALITEAQRSLFLHSQLLRTAFPALNGYAGSMTNSGLATALAGVSDSLNALEGLKQLLRGPLNPLGFEPDFLMLVENFHGPGSDIFDSFDALTNRASEWLGVAETALTNAGTSYRMVRESEGELAGQFDDSSITYMDRLRDIVGKFPNDPTYNNFPKGALGSELNLQFLSISNALLGVTNISVRMSNVFATINIELERVGRVTNAYVKYGNQRARLVNEISKIRARMAAADAVAGSLSVAGWGQFFGTLVVGAADAAMQAQGEVEIGNKEEALENLAAQQDAEIEGLNATAQVRTWMLELKTLDVDLTAALVRLQQDLNLLASLYREKADLERRLKEKDASLAGRYFADPVHRLAMQANMQAADAEFQRAQKWLFFTVRALEYKWNLPFVGFESPPGGQVWSADSLFKLRNAGELRGLYNAMVEYDALVNRGRTYRFDWFSVREDFLGYKGGTNRYVDPVTGLSLDATNAFRTNLVRRLKVSGNNEWFEVEFNTVRQIPGGFFFVGPTFYDDGSLNTRGRFLDKIDYLQIRLPGNHTLGGSQLSGNLTYGGTSYIRNYSVGHFETRRDQLVDEMTAYSTRYWYYDPTPGQQRWKFKDAYAVEGVEMELHPDPRVPPTVQAIEEFKERSVAATGWILRIPTRQQGEQVLNINELDDIEIYFHHYSAARQ